MKRLLAFVFAAIMIVLCSGCSDTAEVERLRQENEELKQQIASLTAGDSDNSDNSDSGDGGKSYTESDVQNLLYISFIDSLKPDSAGGVDVKVHFTNEGSETIKYITFELVPYNAVDDIVSSEIDGKTNATLRLTGPCEAGEGTTGTWEDVWYNSTIKYTKLLRIKIEYMNGEIIELNEQEAQYSRYRYQKYSST